MSTTNHGIDLSRLSRPQLRELADDVSAAPGASAGADGHQQQLLGLPCAKMNEPSPAMNTPGYAPEELPSSIMELDAIRYQAAKDALDGLAYPLRIYRDYDEPNEFFAARVLDFLRNLIAAPRDDAGRVPLLNRFNCNTTQPS